MARDNVAPDITAVLARAIAADVFPARSRRTAETLLDRLKTPTRIALLGRPMSGKTSVFNLLANDKVLSPGADLGWITLRHGAQADTTFFFEGGGGETVPGYPGNGIGQVPTKTDIRAPLPALGKISLHQVANLPDPAALTEASALVAKQADITIWCTRDFDQADRRLWETLPEELNDHAFLVRTNWDADSETRDDAEQALRASAEPYFSRVRAISAETADAARATENVDKALLKASGATKLISAIIKDLERGRQSLIDSVEILFAQHGIGPDTVLADSAVTDESAERAEAAVPATPPVSDQPEPAVMQQEAQPEEPQPEPEHGTAVSVDVIALFQTGADRLQTVGQALIGDGSDPDPQDVLATSADALIWLDDHLCDRAAPDHPAVDEMRHLTQGANDIVQLLRLEGDHTSSVDAAVLLIQMRLTLLSRIAA